MSEQRKVLVDLPDCRLVLERGTHQRELWSYTLMTDSFGSKYWSRDAEFESYRWTWRLLEVAGIDATFEDQP